MAMAAAMTMAMAAEGAGAPMFIPKLLEAAKLFPKPEGIQFSYGTAGFRAEAHLLPSVVFRTALLAALRSVKTNRVTGMMVTASHNPIKDNGVKVVDPQGGMLAIEWEDYAERLANAHNAVGVCELVKEIAVKEKITLGISSNVGKVLLARDTRPSGLELASAARKGVEALVGMEVLDMGVLSTPQLHWMVRIMNLGKKATENDYYDSLLSGFRVLDALRLHGQVDTTTQQAYDLCSLQGSDHVKKGARDRSRDTLVVDGANGVGATKLIALHNLIGVGDLELEVRNKGEEGDGLLNDGVGADFVQKEKLPPQNFGEQDLGKRCASVDGDADRLVYFYLKKNGIAGTDHEAAKSSFAKTAALSLLDGDKIAVLAAVFINDQLHDLGATKKNDDGNEDLVIDGYGPVSVGVVQTAYANGASTMYIRETLGLKVAVTPTGVKHLHKKAALFDVGIYFEANGHGTVLFGKRFLNWLAEQQQQQPLQADRNDVRSDRQKREQAISRLIALSNLINQAVGDALSMILLVEIILRYRKCGLQEWEALYQDLPSRHCKVKVPDRRSIVTNYAETEIESPALLQHLIDQEIVKYEKGRAFVRPSGTEDVVRIYAEAEVQADADALAESIANHIRSVFG